MDFLGASLRAGGVGGVLDESVLQLSSAGVRVEEVRRLPSGRLLRSPVSAEGLDDQWENSFILQTFSSLFLFPFSNSSSDQHKSECAVLEKAGRAGNEELLEQLQEQRGLRLVSDRENFCQCHWIQINIYVTFLSIDSIIHGEKLVKIFWLIFCPNFWTIFTLKSIVPTCSNWCAGLVCLCTEKIGHFWLRGNE